MRPSTRLCDVSTCPHTFFHVAGRIYPTLCLDHAEEARRVGLLTCDRTTGGTVWFPPIAPT